MEVEDAHCFAVMGGLVVHNCRYGLAAHPAKTRKLEPEDTSDKFALHAPRIDEMPESKRRQLVRRQLLDKDYGAF